MNDCGSSPLAKEREAIEVMSELLERMSDPQFQEDIQVLSLELADATEELNEALKRIETGFRRLKLRPGWVMLEKSKRGHELSLVWDGDKLQIDRRKGDLHQVQPLLGSSRECRMLAADRLDKLAKRLISAD